MRRKSSSKAVVHPVWEFHQLPSAILTLAAALSPADKEVLSYLISFSPPPNNSNNTHKHYYKCSSRCDCFSCYTSYWARWNTSPNRHLIHDIIEAYEQQPILINTTFTFSFSLLSPPAHNNHITNSTYNKSSRGGGTKRERKKRTRARLPADSTPSETEPVVEKEREEEGIENISGGDEKGELGTSNISKLVAFIAHKLWAVWS